MVSLTWRSHRHAAVEYGLRPIERGLVDQRLEVAARRHAAVRALDLADVNPVPQHVAEASAARADSPSAPQAGVRGAANDFLLRELARGEILERLPHQRTAHRIVHEAALRPLRRVEVAERRLEGPTSERQRSLHAGAVCVPSARRCRTARTRPARLPSACRWTCRRSARWRTAAKCPATSGARGARSGRTSPARNA